MPQVNLINFKTGWKTSEEPFIVEDDAFPILHNAIVDHGRISKISGYNKVGLTSIEISGNLTLDTTQDPVTFNISDELLQGIPDTHSKLIAQGSITLTINSVEYNDIDGVFVDSNMNMFGSINYATGECSIPQSIASTSVSIVFSYHPMLPIVGFHQYSDSFSIAFDTSFAYQVLPKIGVPQNFSRMSSYLGSTNLLNFSGDNSNLFSFSQANMFLFCTNGVAGNHTFGGITGVARGSSTTFTMSTTESFATNDTVFLCGFGGTTELNGLTANVTSTTSTSVTVNIDSTSFSAYTMGGNIQLLNKTGSGDGIKLFYNSGFLNFSPPLDSSTNPSYLLGCDHMLFYNNRLMCFGTTEGKAGEEGVYDPLRIRYSQTANFVHFRNSLIDQTLSSDGLPAWFEDRSNALGNAGFLNLSDGGRIVYSQVLKSYIICGLESGFVRLQISTTPFAIAPFLPFYYRSILGSISKNAVSHLDEFIMSIGSKGIIGTSFNSTKRLDENIIDQFEHIDRESRNEFKTTSIRDTKREIIYINYVADSDGSQFPTKCFAYNYNNHTFSLLDQKFTYQGVMTVTSLPTWDDISMMTWGDLDGTWSQFLENSFTRSTVGCTSQGAVLIRSEMENSVYSIPIESFVVNRMSNSTTMNSRNHSMVVGDFVRFTELEFENNDSNIVCVKSIDSNSFVVDGICSNETYNGMALGEFLPRVTIRTKAFNLWQNGNRIMLNSSAVLLDSDEDLRFSVEVLGDQEENPSVSTSVSPTSKGSAHNPNNIRWVRSTYTNQTRDSIQLQLTFTDNEMRNEITHSSQFKVHAITLDLEQGGFVS